MTVGSVFDFFIKHPIMYDCIVLRDPDLKFVEATLFFADLAEYWNQPLSSVTYQSNCIVYLVLKNHV